MGLLISGWLVAGALGVILAIDWARDQSDVTLMETVMLILFGLPAGLLMLVVSAGVRWTDKHIAIVVFKKR